MSFFAFSNRDMSGRVAGLSLDLIKRNECAVCPLNHEPGLCHPKMKPDGSTKPFIYVIGESPGATEDEKGRPFVGPSGKLLRQYIPDKYIQLIRWNNSIRCKPSKKDGKQTPPSEIMLAACQPSIVRDIEATKPKAIFAFGNVALWLINESGITRWCGRQTPVKVGDYTCWLFPFVHPASILYEEGHVKYVNKHAPYKTELETQFATQMKAAFAAIDNLPEPVVWSRDDILADIDTVTGSGGEADIDRVVEFLREINHEDYVGFDYETNKLRPWNDGAKILSAAWSGQDRAMAVALDHKNANWTMELLNRLFKVLKNFLEKRKCRLIAHHLPFELEWTAYTFGRGLLWKGGWEDTESQAFILDERANALSLEFLCKQALGINVKEIDNLDRKNLADAPLDLLLRYNGMDSKCHRLLFESQARRVKWDGLSEVYQHQRDRTIAATAVQMKGIPVDQEVNRALLTKYITRLKKLERQIAADPDVNDFERRTGKRYRPSAPQDAAAFVRQVVGTKLDNSDAKSLGTIDHPVIKDTLRWRQVNKIASTYVLPVTEGGSIEVGDLIVEIPRSPHLQDDGLVRPILNTTRTRTNRTSSEDPNAQNWPIRTKQGLEARRQIAPGLDEVVVAFDYSGIQARNVAMESKDRALVKAFFNNYDIHKDWMERIQREAERRGERWIPGGLKAAAADGDLHKKYRHSAKNKFVFPSFFGAQPRSLAANLGVSERVAYAVHEQFWDEFPDIKAWQKRTIKNYYETGYVTGLSGFRRHAPVAYTELINCPIQSDEAKIVCDAMIRLSRLGEDPNLEVHDDLTFILRKKNVDRLSEIIIGEMLTISFPWINVPLEVEMSLGKNWADKEKIGSFNSTDWFGKKKHRPYTSSPNSGSWSDGTGWQGLPRHSLEPAYG